MNFHLRKNRGKLLQLENLSRLHFHCYKVSYFASLIYFRKLVSIWLYCSCNSDLYVLPLHDEMSNIRLLKNTCDAAGLTVHTCDCLSGNDNPWLIPTQDHLHESMESVYLELHATAVLSLPSGECMAPDATICTTLTSALYSSVSEEEVLHRELMVNIVTFTLKFFITNDINV